MTEEIKTWWLAVYEKGGLPLLMLGVCGFAFYQGTIWIGENVGRPLINKHVEFLDTTIKQQNALVEATKEIRMSMLGQSAVITQNQLDIKVNQALIRDGNMQTAASFDALNATQENVLKTLESIDSKTEKKP